jgi:hypothetical protein
VLVKEIIANRGRCKATKVGDLSRAYKFGERVRVGYVFCNVIEIVVRTSAGDWTFTWDN